MILNSKEFLTSRRIRVTTTKTTRKVVSIVERGKGKSSDIFVAILLSFLLFLLYHLLFPQRKMHAKIS